MLLLFPNLDTFRFALTSGIVPVEVSSRGTTYSTTADGKLIVACDWKLTKKQKAELERLSIAGAKHHVGHAESVPSWLAIVPLRIEATLPQVASQTPILFELPHAELLPTIAGEILRLGNDRQSVRYLTEGTTTRVLLRVIAPPYYTLLRAIDHSSSDNSKYGRIRAYSEAAPRVWVELGHSHPFAAQLAPADGQLLLLGAPRDWQTIADEPFTDVYEIVTFTVPHQSTTWTDATPSAKINVPLRLVAGNAAEVAEMWVLPSSGLARLDDMVRESDDRLTEQLVFAVGKMGDDECIVLKARNAKATPPVLTLDGAQPFRSFWRIPNLFLPVGTRLHPTIRRDLVTKLLADNRDQLVWLAPNKAGEFTPHTLAEDSFRPLSDWVEYIIDTHKVELKAWMDASPFAFEPFVCSENPPKPKPPTEKTPKDRKEQDETTTKSMTKPMATVSGPKKGPSNEANFDAVGVERRPPNEWRIRCDELEKQFLAIEGPLDSAERVALWPELATANVGIGEERTSEAAVCWVNSLWASPSPQFVLDWARSETPNTKFPLTASEFDGRLKSQNPTPSEMRAFASGYLATALSSPDWLKSRVGAIQKYLEFHEQKLPIRAVWLVATQLAKQSGGDVLGLARVRDRLLNRLLDRGLSPEQDLPGFLRYSGLKDSDRVRIVREKAVELHRTIRTWTEKSLKPTGGPLSSGSSGQGAIDTTATPAYLDLMFAFGVAKLGEYTVATTLQANAKKILVQGKPSDTKGIVSQFLFHAFSHRIADAVNGKPHSGALPSSMLEDLEAIQKKGESTPNDPHKLGHYMIARMREQSKILEPMEKLDPYALWMKQDDLKRELTELPRIKDPRVLEKKIRDLLKDGAKGRSTNESKFLVLHESLFHAAKVGQDFTVELLKQVPTVLKASPSAGTPVAADAAKKQGQLLERALFLAAHFDKTDLVQTLVDQFIEHVRTKPDDQRFELVNVVASQCLRSLRKVGLRDEIDKLLRRMQDEILKGRTIAQLKIEYAAKPDVWWDVLQTLLNLAAGWLTFGLMDQANPILDVARTEIIAATPGLTMNKEQKFCRLCCAYVSAVGQGPADGGIERLRELFDRLKPEIIPNRFTTASCYSRLHLNLIEEVVLAIVSDDFALGQAGKRWLDEDEHLVRRRIHTDMRELVKSSGV